ncbi:MAG: winged helix-turn-helix transcriptional regulator [Tissierellia bacterium]|nr:winged helix-turn-helix transcriptional regulator [Tissierellia bacterium]
MANEADILQIIADNPQISQRKIAEKTGISLGQVNFLIKKCAKKGLIKIEGQSPKSIRYNITPKGLKEKAELTLNYIKLSYKAIIAISDRIKSITDVQIKLGRKIYVYGNNDEIMELLKLVLEEKKAEYEIINDISEIDSEIDYVIYIWEYELSFKLNEYSHINIIK